VADDPRHEQVDIQRIGGQATVAKASVLPRTVQDKPP
jgi:hypothetical protein